MAKKAKSAKRPKTRERREQRFEPVAGAGPGLVYALGAIGAFIMGLGAWAEFGSLVHDGGPEPLKVAPYILAAGALLVAVAVWIGTSGEASLRVGDAGLAVERAGVRRMPWYAVERVFWQDQAVRVTGKDESGTEMSVVASLRHQPQAAAWIVKEARERIASAVDVPADAPLPAPRAGHALPLEPPQLVGRHCAASGKVISYEPDGRLCPRCERVYHKAHVPDTCTCGASLAELQSESKSA